MAKNTSNNLLLGAGVAAAVAGAGFWLFRGPLRAAPGERPLTAGERKELAELQSRLRGRVGTRELIEITGRIAELQGQP